MTLTELRYILAVAKNKHFGRAANDCNVSQPTLSVAVKKLEKSLGVEIFERDRNDIRITEVGEKIIEQAQQVLEQAQAIKIIAEGSKSHLTSPLRIGAIYTIGPYLFPSIISQLKAMAPDMPLVIQEDFTANLRVKLAQGQLDAIFIALPFEEPNVLTKPVYEEAFVVLMPKDHPLAKKSAVDEMDLISENVMLLGEGHCFRDQILQMCPSCNQSNGFGQTVEGTSLETIRHMVASGMGLTIIPSTAAQVHAYDDTLVTRPFKNNKPKRTVALAWRMSFPRTKAIDEMIKALEGANISNVCLIGS